jgi:hypothetical protein
LLLPEPDEAAASGDTSAMEEETEDGGDEGGVITKKGEPTHWKQLDPKSMKVDNPQKSL